MILETEILAKRDLGEKFDKFIDIKLKCEDMGISYPKEIEEYFGAKLIRKSVDVIKDKMAFTDITSKAEVYDAGKDTGYLVKIKDLPSDTEAICFLNITK